MFNCRIREYLQIFISGILICAASSCSTSRNIRSANISTVSADSFDLKILCATGMRQVILDLVPKFEQASQYRVSVSFKSSGDIAKWLDSGKHADVIIIFRPAIDQLILTKKITGSSPIDIAKSEVGVAVRKGNLKPDISSVDAFKKSLLNAKTISCPDPARGGASGMYIADIFERLGIKDSVKSKLVLSSSPEDEKTMPGSLVATGKAELALHQMQELLAVPDIDIVGPLPESLREKFLFTAAITSNPKNKGAAEQLIQFLNSTEAKSVIRKKGMESFGQ